MSIQRWEPVRDMLTLREAMDRLLEESIVPSRGAATTARGLPLDVSETEDTFIIETSIPGVKPEDVDITVQGDSVRISADIKETEERIGERWLVRERHRGHVERSVTLPATVKADGCNADFEDGILRVTLPKSEESRPRSIPVGRNRGSESNREIEAKSRTEPE